MKFPTFSLVAAVLGCCCAGLSLIAPVATATAAEPQAHHGHSLLKHPAIESAIARAKDKLPMPTVIEELSKRHSLLAPADPGKTSVGPVVLMPETNLPAAAPSSFTQGLPEAASIAGQLPTAAGMAR